MELGRGLGRRRGRTAVAQSRSSQPLLGRPNMSSITHCRNRVFCALAAAVAAVLTAGLAAAADVPTRAVREAAGDEKPTGRLEGRIKLPDRKVKLPDFAVKA